MPPRNATGQIPGPQRIERVLITGSQANDLDPTDANPHALVAGIIRLVSTKRPAAGSGRAEYVPPARQVDGIRSAWIPVRDASVDTSLKHPPTSGWGSTRG